MAEQGFMTDQIQEMENKTVDDTFDNPEDSTDVEYCQGCGKILDDEEIENNVDNCDTCKADGGDFDDEQEELKQGDNE